MKIKVINEDEREKKAIWWTAWIFGGILGAIFSLWSVAPALAYDTSTLPDLNGTYTERIIYTDQTDVFAVDVNETSTNYCSPYYWWFDGVTIQDGFYLVGSSGNEPGLLSCYSNVYRKMTADGDNWTTPDIGVVSNAWVGLLPTANLPSDVFLYTSKNIYSISGSYYLNTYGFSNPPNNTLVQSAFAPPVSSELPFSWMHPFGWSLDDVSAFYVKSPTYTYDSNDNPRFGFNTFLDPEINLGFATSECFGTLPLEGQTSEGCEPVDYTISLYQGETLLESLDVVTGQSKVGPLGYLRWNYPSASTQQPFDVTVFLPETPATDIEYTIKAFDVNDEELAGMDFSVGQTLDISTYDQAGAVAYVCDNLDGTILPLDDVCRLIIPEPNYLSNEFRKTLNNFFSKFYFLSQAKDIIGAGLVIFSENPTLPPDMNFTFYGHTYSFLDFGLIEPWAVDLRNGSGLIMWCLTFLVLLQVLNSIFTPSQEDDLI